jgi:hypothetical protein
VEIGPAPLQLGEGDEEEAAGRSLNRYLDSVIREITTLGVIGVIGLLVAPHLLQAPLRDLQARPLSNLGVGMLSFLLSFPIMLIAAVITLVILFILSLFRLQGVMVAGAIILGLVDLGGASLFYFVAIYLARVVVCLAVGRIVVQAAVGDDGSQRIVYISLIAGVAILAVTASLPFVGWLFNAVALFLGLGAILTVLQHQWQRFRETTPTPVTYPAGYPLTFPPLPSRSEDARHIPPPIIDDSDVPPGLDNLPDGFTWWTDD